MSSTAILIFARSAGLEGISKHIGGDVNDTITLFDILNKKVVRLAKNSGSPYFVYNETCQMGDTFGEKLANAVSDIFKKGFEKVIILGNDCLQLRKDTLRNAARQLDKVNMVIGPDHHGGAYLIGINVSVFDKQSFASLKWQTKLLYRNLQQYSTTSSSLPFLFDLNVPTDARLLIKILFTRSLWSKLLGRIIRNHTIDFFYVKGICLFLYATIKSLRAPPAFVYN